MMPYQEIEFPPGSQFGYSNPAFIYLARIIEQLTGTRTRCTSRRTSGPRSA